MKRYREWSATQPAGVQFVTFALLVAAVILVLTALRGHPSVVTALVVGFLISALVTPVAIVRRRALSRYRLIVEVSEALRSGLVPVSIDVAAWKAALSRRRTWALRFLVAGVVLVLASGGFVTWAVIASAQRLEHGLSAVLFAGGGVWLVVGSLVQLPRIRRVHSRIADGYGVVLGTRAS